MATIGSRAAAAFGLDGDAWQRHANPWSVYTRIPIPALLNWFLDRMALLYDDMTADPTAP